MKHKKLLALLAVLSLCVSILAGCETNRSDISTPAQEVSEPAAEQVEAVEEAPVEPDAVLGPVEEPAFGESEAAVASAIPGTAAIEALNSGKIDQSCQLPLTDQEATISYWCSTNFGGNVPISSWTEHYGLNYAQEKTGVKLDIYECNMTVETERFNIMIASNELCDIMVNFESQYSSGVDSAIEEGLVVNLLDYMDFAPVYGQLLEVDPDWCSSLLSENGNLISFKTLYTKSSWIGQSIAIRGDWLEELGMDVPTTYDEYFDVLSAFKTTYDPDYCLNIGSALGNSWFEGGYGISVSASGNASTGDFYIENGTVYAGYTSDRFLNYVTMLHQWHDAGLISDDYVTIGNLEFFENDYASLIAAGEFGCVLGAGGLLGSYAALSDDENFEFVPGYLPRQAQDPTLCYLTPTSYTGTNYAPSITTSCSNIELAMAFLDYFYTEEGVELANFGIEGESFTYNESGEAQLSEAITGSGDVSAALTPYKVNISTISDPNAQTRAMMTETACNIMQFWTEDQTGLMDQGNNAYYPSDVSLTAKELEKATSVMADISTYVSEAIPKFILGSTSLDEWDTYCETINAMGIDTVVEIYQAGYDRYIA